MVITSSNSMSTTMPLMQMMFSFMMAEDKTPLRMCDSCDTIFITNRKTRRFYCDKCRYKSD